MGLNVIEVCWWLEETFYLFPSVYLQLGSKIRRRFLLFRHKISRIFWQFATLFPVKGASEMDNPRIRTGKASLLDGFRAGEYYCYVQLQTKLSIRLKWIWLDPGRADVCGYVMLNNKRALEDVDEEDGWQSKGTDKFGCTVHTLIGFGWTREQAERYNFKLGSKKPKSLFLGTDCYITLYQKYTAKRSFPSIASLPK